MEEVVINCRGCGRELARGDPSEPLLGAYDDESPYCANCTADNQAQQEWEASLEERFLQDQYDRQVRAQAELERGK